MLGATPGTSHDDHVHQMRRALRSAAALLGVIAGLILVACSPAASAPSASPTPTPPVVATPVPTPQVTTPPSPTAHVCPGGNPANHCLGAISSGTYTTSVFTPQLTYTVPDGWANYEDLPGNFLIAPPGATHEGIDPGLSDYIGVYTSIAAPLKDCSSRPDPAVTKTAAGYIDWAQSNPLLTVSTPADVTLDGRSGQAIDVALNPSASNLCSDPVQGIPAFAEIMIGQRPSDFSASVLPTLSIRVEVFDVDGKVLAILLSNTLDGGSDYPDFWSSAQPVDDSFVFGD